MFSLVAFSTETIWGVYLSAAVLICLMAFMLIRRWQADIRLLLLTLLALFLFLPAPVPGRAPLQAPAMIFIALSPFTGTPETLAPILVRYSVGTVLAILFVIIAGVLRRVWRRRHAH